MSTDAQSPNDFVDDHAKAVRPHDWQRGYLVPSERVKIAFDSLDIFVVTNDDPFLISDSRIATMGYGQPESNARHVANARLDVWCAENVEKSVNELRARRADLEHTLVLHTIAAGLPSLITGGKPLGEPGRAIVAICDVEGRLLSIGVGVPEPDELLAMVEDAQVALWIRKRFMI